MAKQPKEKKTKEKKVSKSSLPTKRNINLVAAARKKMRLGIAVPAIVLILLAALAISKFTVIDRFNSLYNEEQKIRDLQAQLDVGYARIDSYGDLSDMYAHYTYSGLTEEELIKVDRVAILDMLKRDVLPYLDLDSWEIKDNELTLVVLGDDLQQANIVANNLQENESIVDFCTVKLAEKKGTSTTEKNRVTVNITAYLYDAKEAQI